MGQKGLAHQFVQLPCNDIHNIHISEIHTFNLVYKISGQNLSLSVCLSVCMPTVLLITNHYYC